MSYNLKFAVKNLITNEDVAVDNGDAKRPLFNVEQYKIRVYFPNSSSYTKTYRKAVRWDFGDGTVVEGASAEHYYKTPGNYIIRCTFYNIDRKPVENEYTVRVYVKEIIPIKLAFVNPEEIAAKKVYASKITKLLTLESSVSASVKTLAPIICRRISDASENSYFNVRNKEFYHLDKYYTFLKENVSYSFKKDVEDKITLSPTQYYIPTYTPIYVKFENNNGAIDTRLMAYIENEKISVPDTYEIFNPNSVARIDENNFVTLPLEKVRNKSALEGAEHCGWISTLNIWYKDDYNTSKDIYFAYDTKYLEFYDNGVDINSINIPPIGITVDVLKVDESDLLYALTPLGLLGDEADNVDPEDKTLVIEKHLRHNFYIDYKVNGYFAEYIKNESPDGSTSWSIVKASKKALPELQAENCILESERVNDYITKYTFTPEHSNMKLYFDKEPEPEYATGWIQLETNTPTWKLIIGEYGPYIMPDYDIVYAHHWSEFINNLNIPYESYVEDPSNPYCSKFYIKAKNPGPDYCVEFGIAYQPDMLRDGICIYNGPTLAIEKKEQPRVAAEINGLKGLYSIMIPEKNYDYINFHGVLDAYMPHTMFEDAVNLKEFLEQLFLTNNLFETINNKGFSFFDDTVNHKTCYINNLQSILRMFGSDELVYNINSFDKINELRDLVRILSMQYCDLFGRFTDAPWDISIHGDIKGKSVGDRILATDTIACDYDNNIIAIIRNDEIYPVSICSNSIIVYDNFTKESRLVAFDNATSSGEHPRHSEFIDRGYYISHYYSLCDYDYSWNWNLQLPKEITNSVNLSNFIEGAYTFYLCIPNSDESDYKHNYLDRTTFPYIDNHRITPEEWYRDFSHTYDCLMKVLIYKLGLD